MTDDQFENFIKLLDAALVSDDKKIKTALRKFMFIMALNLSDDDCEPGPFTKMMETMDELQRRLAILETKDNAFTTTDPYTQTWPYGGTATPSYIPPSTTGGSITASGTTQWINAPSATTAVTWTNTATTANQILGGTSTVTSIDENTGTAIKNEIKVGLEKLAKSA